ncbi:caspase family protein [Chitinophaga flava]|uniref:Peptidase C14 caspase catalytic subunit p20 n=1 Tax=Chitinophaga flava TaxID=2259036 RepID=A0A365Y3G1_9BACT|nr:caspase family protein [Chitinophaga flava]RBL93040.1 hypothetical protein DF182_10855 [Chitinophaga flava]
MSNIFVLLVGIDKYSDFPLNGCVNDTTAMESFLQKSFSDDELKVKILTDTEATRNNLIASFSFFDDAKDGDTCLFYYSGHGSRMPAPKDLDNEGDPYVQTFVCFDSREAEGRDLIDKEVAFLIRKATQNKKIDFIAITDSCFSGGVTKGASEDSDSKKYRRVSPSPKNINSVKDYHGFDEDSYDRTRDGRLKVKKGPHLHLAASSPTELSAEILLDGKIQGVFTHCLLKILETENREINYRSLMDRVKGNVKNTVKDQTPEMHLIGDISPDDQQHIFLTRNKIVNQNRYTVSFDTSYDWCVNAGPWQNVMEGDQLILQDKSHSKLNVLKAVRPDQSQITKPSHIQDKSVQIPALVERKDLRTTAITLHIDITPEARQHLLNAADEFNSAYFHLTSEPNGLYQIKQTNNGDLIFVRTQEDKLIDTPKTVDNRDSALELLSNLEKVLKWEQMKKLENPDSTLKNVYKIRLFKLHSSEREEITDPFAINDLWWKGDDWEMPSIEIELENLSSHPLYASFAYLNVEYGVKADFFDNDMKLQPRDTKKVILKTHGGDTTKIPLHIDKELLSKGYFEITEYLKIFIGTSRIDTERYAQENLGATNEKSDITNTITKGPYIGPPVSDSWDVALLGFRIIHPRDEKNIHEAVNGKIVLNGITVEVPTGLTGSIGLSSSNVVTKNTTGITPPAYASKDNGIIPFNLVPGDTTQPITDIIELFDVSNPELVTHENPVILHLTKHKGEEDKDLLPVGYDEETGLYYPVGFHTEDHTVHITTLPTPTTSDAAVTKRSFTGSIKIYFLKVIGRRIGMRYDYPRLAIPQLSLDNEVSYNYKSADVAAAVEKADSIVLFIHGIIGDTENMAKCITTPLKDASTLSNKCDLILTYDYENLHTTIEENAELLARKLHEVGLTNNHSKKLTIVAHSMGGLVCRHFIEQLKGQTVVSKLIMLGTPNNGTPWADVRDMIDLLLTYALNNLITLKPWMQVLLAASKRFVKGTQVTLKQMNAHSGIYANLNTGKDPETPYVIIAGNTKLLTTGHGDIMERLKKLFSRKQMMYDTLNILFQKPNDIAVSTESITQLRNSDNWSLKPIRKEIASDHMSYFFMQEVLDDIAEHIIVPPSVN